MGDFHPLLYAGLSRRFHNVPIQSLYNRRFSLRPRDKDDVHRPLPRGMDLNAFLCIKTERTLRNDFTVAHNHKLYQIEDATNASQVIVQDRLDGSMMITYQGRACDSKR